MYLQMGHPEVMGEERPKGQHYSMYLQMGHPEVMGEERPKGPDGEEI